MQSRFGRKPALRRHLLLGLVLLAVLAGIVRCAWVSDDAYITFRVVDNLWHGYGLRWNVSERVWVYSNPLMMLCMAALYPMTREFFYTSILFGAGVSAAALGILLWGLAPAATMAILAGGLLAVSKAFIDYCTSGLENALTFLLLAIFYWLAFKRDMRSDKAFTALAWTAGLALLNRMDTLLLCAPLLALAWWRSPSAGRLLRLAAGLTPFLLWEIFAIVYYGWPLPNPAYVKLGLDIPRLVLLPKGLAYFANSLLLDPITLPVIGVALLACLWSRVTGHVAAALGVLLHLIYVVWIGGDFMSGRLFAAPMFGAVALLCTLPRMPPHRVRVGGAVAATLAILAVGLLHPLSPPRSGADYSTGRMALQDYEHAWGISDERAVYYPGTGLLRARVHAGMPDGPPRREGEAARDAGERVLVSGAIGFRGMFAGPTVHIIDVFAIADPFLARLPARLHPPPRIGHFTRDVPAGYVESRRAGENRLEDPDLAQLFEVIRRVTAGPLWGRQRWIDIAKLNTGRYARLVDEER